MDPTVAQLIAQNRPLAFAITDRDLRVQRCGGSPLLLGADCVAVVGLYLWEMVSELIGYEADLHALVAGHQPRIELPFVNRESDNEKPLYVTLLCLPYTNTHGALEGVLYIVEDVTELGTAEQDLLQQRNELHLLRDKLADQNRKLRAINSELQELDEIKSRFVSVASHELNNPIAAATMYAELMIEGVYGELTSEQRHTVEVLRNTLLRLNTIASQMLDVTRIETGRIEILLQPIHLDHLVGNVIDEMQPTLSAKDQQCVVQVAPDLPLALCDEMRATQIVYNLLSNASKYAPEGSTITIRLALASEEGYLQVSVADQGIGVAPGEQERLFERFFRASNARLSSSKGVGLGLSIVRSLVELHGGRIWFESTLNQGSTFHVTFPVDDGLLIA